LLDYVQQTKPLIDDNGDIIIVTLNNIIRKQFIGDPLIVFGNAHNTWEAKTQ